MTTYSAHRPTAFDQHIQLEGREHWLVVPVSQTRDSECLDQSNFRSALKMLGGEDERCEVHRFGHWGPGWYEIILIHPAFGYLIDQIKESLENYPILDDSDYYELESETAQNYWKMCSIADRVEWCQRYHVSIFAARWDEIPEDQSGELLSALAN